MSTMPTKIVTLDDALALAIEITKTSGRIIGACDYIGTDFVKTLVHRIGEAKALADIPDSPTVRAWEEKLPQLVENLRAAHETLETAARAIVDDLAPQVKLMADALPQPD